MELLAGGNAALVSNCVRLMANTVNQAKWVLIRQHAKDKAMASEVVDGKSLSGDVIIMGTPDGGLCADIDLLKVKPEIEKLSLVLISNSNSPLRDVISLTVQDGRHDSHQIQDAKQSRLESLLIVTELYRHKSGWKVKHIGAGFNDVTKAMRDHFGIQSGSQGNNNASVVVRQVSSPAPATVAHQQIYVDPIPVPWMEEGSPLRRTVMGILDGVRKFANMGRSELATQVGRIKNRVFMEGTVAICTYVAMASNGAGSTEKNKMLSFIQRSEELKVYNTSEVIEYFNKLVSNYEFDREVGKGEAMKVIMALKDKRDEAQLALRVGISVAKSDGDFDNDEQTAVKTICHNLGFKESDFDL